MRTGLVRSRGQQRSNGRLIGIPRALAEHMPNLPAVLRVQEGSRKGSVPSWQYPLSEEFLAARFFPVVGKNRLVAGQKTPHQDQIPVIINAHNHDIQTLRGVLLG